MPEPPNLHVLNTKFGFNSHYLCPVCYTFIKQDWAWNTLASLTDNYSTALSICPICKTNYDIPLAGLARPFYNVAYNLADIPSFFQPSDISGLNLWLDASNPTLVQMSGSQVVKWSDRTNNNFDFINHTGICTYANLGIVFDGSSFLYNTVKENFQFMHEQSFTFFIVGNLGAPFYPAFMLGNAFSSAHKGFFFGRNWKGLFHVLINGIPALNVYTFNQLGQRLLLDLHTHIFSINFDNSVNIGSITATFFRDSSLLYSKNKNNSVSIGPPHSALCIGNISTDYLYSFWKGSINEILIYSNSLSASETAAVNNYLTAKWSI